LISGWVKSRGSLANLIHWKVFDTKSSECPLVELVSLTVVRRAPHSAINYPVQVTGGLLAYVQLLTTSELRTDGGGREE